MGKKNLPAFAGRFNRKVVNLKSHEAIRD